MDLDRSLNSGNLPEDLEAIQRVKLDLFSNPLVKRCMAGFLHSLQTDLDLRRIFCGRVPVTTPVRRRLDHPPRGGARRNPSKPRR